MDLCEFMVKNGIENPTLSRRILLRAAINNTVILEDRQRTNRGNCDLREEDELRFPQCPTSIHTELPHYKYGLRDSKGRVATRRKEILTRVAVTITFLWLTKESVTIPSEYPDVLY